MSQSSKKYELKKELDSLIQTAKNVEKSIAKGVKPAEVKKPQVGGR